MGADHPGCRDQAELNHGRSLAGEFHRRALSVGRTVPEPDEAAGPQHQLLAPQHYVLGLSREPHPRAVGAVVGEYELVTPPLDPGVLAGGLAIAHDDVAGAIAAEGELAGPFEAPFAALVLEHD